MTVANTIMNAATLILLAILVYGWLREFRSADSYRKQHLKLRDDELDVALLTELRLRSLGRPVVARAGEHRQAEHQNGGRDSRELAELSHSGSSFPGWDK